MSSSVDYLWQVTDDFGRLFELCLITETPAAGVPTSSIVLRCTTAKMDGGRRYTSMAVLTREQSGELIAALRTALGEVGP